MHIIIDTNDATGYAILLYAAACWGISRPVASAQSAVSRICPRSLFPALASIWHGSNGLQELFYRARISRRPEGKGGSDSVRKQQQHWCTSAPARHPVMSREPQQKAVEPRPLLHSSFRSSTRLGRGLAGEGLREIAGPWVLRPRRASSGAPQPPSQAQGSTRNRRRLRSLAGGGWRRRPGGRCRRAAWPAPVARARTGVAPADSMWQCAVSVARMLHGRPAGALPFRCLLAIVVITHHNRCR
jgi:hypothetical protein